jgi:hypothetical protein
MDLEALQYPLGRFTEVPLTPAVRAGAIDRLAALPAQVRAAVAGLSGAQLDTVYRPGGWTVRQLVHHIADSHMNGLIRFKLALTEDHPTVKPYDEDAWVRLADARLPLDSSLAILDGVHERWAVGCAALTDDQWMRTFVHPAHGAKTVSWHVQNYAWHSDHHVAHITRLRARQGW